MYLDGQKGGKVGCVTIDTYRNSYRLRFTYPDKKRHTLTIARVSPEGWTTAVKAAQLINRDIDLGDYDDTYARYSPKHARKLELINKEENKEYSLLELWENYKEIRKESIAESTKKREWKRIDKLVNGSPREYLAPIKAKEFILNSLDKYSEGTLKTRLRTLYAAVNLGVAEKKIAENPYLKYFDPYKQNDKEIYCFSSSEIRAIINGFESNEFVDPSTRKDRNHSYYAPYVEFLALTGCRPEEAIALTWSDIRNKHGETRISFSKAFSEGVLLPPKTFEIRLFPCNEQMLEFLDRCPRRDNPNNLIFPARKGGYLNQGNFRTRCWTKVLFPLVERGEVEQYLKPYCLRHSFITRLIREGVDIKTVAAISGNSVETIINSYLAYNSKIKLPEM